jgi:hypothetical protein
LFDGSLKNPIWKNAQKESGYPHRPIDFFESPINIPRGKNVTSSVFFSSLSLIHLPHTCQKT